LTVERILGQQPAADCGPDELLGNAHTPPGRALGQFRAGTQIHPEAVHVAGRDAV